GQRSYGFLAPHADLEDIEDRTGAAAWKAGDGLSDQPPIRPGAGAVIEIGAVPYAFRAVLPGGLLGSGRVSRENAEQQQAHRVFHRVAIRFLPRVTWTIAAVMRVPGRARIGMSGIIFSR